MEEWLTAFNGRMKMQKRHDLLFLDKATCHPHIELSNVRLAWLPPNTTSTLTKRKPGFCGKIFWTLEIQFKTGFTVLIVYFACTFQVTLQFLK
jgi:hypothetical protein